MCDESLVKQFLFFFFFKHADNTAYLGDGNRLLVYLQTVKRLRVRGFSIYTKLKKLYKEQAKTEKGFRIFELFLIVTNQQSHCCNCRCCSFAFLKIILKNFVLFDFRGHENVTLTFSWNLVPNAGILHRIKAEDTFSFSFPDTYLRS